MPELSGNPHSFPINIMDYLSFGASSDSAFASYVLLLIMTLHTQAYAESVCTNRYVRIGTAVFFFFNLKSY